MSFFTKFLIFLNITPFIVTAFNASNSQKVEGIYSGNVVFVVQAGYRPKQNEIGKYVISLRSGKKKKFFGDNHACGGSILTSKAILTAGHCVVYKHTSEVKPLKGFRAVAGTPNLFKKRYATRIFKIVKIVMHPRYDPKDLTADLAVLFLNRKIDFDNETRGLIKLIHKAPVPETNCSLIGWGRIFLDGPRPAILTKVDLTVMNRAVCRHRSRHKLCTCNYDSLEMASARGDSGGPLICGGKLAGVLSSSEKINDLTVDRRYALHTYFTNVYEYKTWIQQTASNCAVLKFDFIEILPLYLLGNIVQ